MIRFQAPDRGNIEEEKRAARNAVLRQFAFFFTCIAIYRAGEWYIVLILYISL